MSIYLPSSSFINLAVHNVDEVLLNPELFLLLLNRKRYSYKPQSTITRVIILYEFQVNRRTI